MKAMILAAGFGERLQPLSLRRPKPLMPVANKPVIEHALTYLKAQGVDQVIINAYHLSDQMTGCFNGNRPDGMTVHVRVEPEILGTGGGIKNVEDFMDGAPFVVINGDILTNIPLARACEEHIRSGAVATLVLHDHAPYSQILMDEQGWILDIQRSPVPGRLAFTGIHILNPSLVSHLPAGVYLDIIDCYSRLLKEGLPLRGTLVSGHYWRDMGSTTGYLLANKEALGQHPFLVDPTCILSGQARLEDWAVLGPGSIVEEGARIARSVLWEGVRIRKGVQVLDSIASAFQDVTTDVVQGVL